MLLSPSPKQSDATRPSPDEILEDLEERVFKDRQPESQPPDDSPRGEEPAA